MTEQSAPEQSVPGQSVPGQSVPGQSVPVRSTTEPRARRPVARVVGAAVAAVSIAIAAFGSVTSAAAGGDPTRSVTLVAPAAAGGGWDGVARSMQQAQRANGIVNSVQVVNMPGAGGTIALGNVARLAGQTDTLLVGGTGLLAAEIQFGSAVTHDDITPLAVTVEEYDVIVVPADSPYETLDDLVAAWRERPGSVPWTGGGSFDQLVVTDLAVSAGIDPTETNYIPSDGGGEAIQALLNGTAAAASGGYPDNIDQIESGRLRALALVAAEPVEGIDIPTAVEQGHDVTLTNWRMIAAPGELDDEQRTQLTDIVLDTLETPEWADAMERYHWTERIITGEDLDAFIDEERERIQGLYEELGR
ncbi:tripartite tricarboxylate transporter substrate-binding protein [Curtobacterium sp. MCSS17_007]|uniref:tripartite tricarboxylate transporter substrate binding protein n=1 Tax=Curtobacterium sp. MCSS17_007 TaxID=2175646 RepID=UPI000DA8F03B|nr:tripartite tricarboxylate transporter substrate-binding protein [Curtobacterium sp. MCSS17_007]WIE75087.1 tripartite tricarboxylate transporter substrate-binding protein [Curtobacterium sp. MCSS17_007]